MVARGSLSTFTMEELTLEEKGKALLKAGSNQLLKVVKVSEDGTMILLEDPKPGALSHFRGRPIRHWFDASDFFTVASEEEMVALKLMGFL